MSEFTSTREHRTGFQRQLLTTVSTIALIGGVFGADQAKASDSGRPLLWIELDGQFADQQISEQAFLPPFLLASQFDAASQIGRMPTSAWDKGAKISFQPEASDWVFSAAIRLGRSTHREALTQVTTHPTHLDNVNFSAYQLSNAQNSESHTILDFQAGKDFGLGKLGSGGRSLLGIGVRYAQFDSHSNSSVRSQPTNKPLYNTYSPHRFYESFSAKRKFTGVGPSLAWMHPPISLATPLREASCSIGA